MTVNFNSQQQQLNATKQTTTTTTSNTNANATNSTIINSSSTIATRDRELQATTTTTTTTTTNSENDNNNDFITIIHFNDCYNVEAGPRSSGAAGFLTAVNQFRHLNPLILFSGDIISPSFMSTFTKGEQMIPVLNKIQVDCAVFGNHEFDFGVDNLIEFTRRTKFPWLLSNVIDKETSNQLGDGQIYHIIERNGIRFGLIGLIEKEWLSILSTLDPCDVIYEDFVTRGRELARQLKSEPHNVDYVIALTHSRTPNDCRLADSVPEIDLILGGHDHDYEVLKRPNCYIIKSGTDFREFSLIKLKLNTQFLLNKKQMIATEHNLINGQQQLNGRAASMSPFSKTIVERIDCADYEQDEELKLELKKFVSTIDEKMDRVLGQFNCDLDGRFSSIRKYETNLGNFVTDIMLASTHADMAILNSGTLRSDRVHPKGDFTMRDLFNILGFIDPISVLQASGWHIWKALENGVSAWPKLEGRFPQVSGCSFAFDPSKEPGHRIDPASITIGDEQLVLNKHYKLTTKAYLASGKDGYDVLKECKTLVPGDESPDLTTSILNHFEAINIVKSNRRTHHRQSIICLSRSSLKKLLDSQQNHADVEFDGNNNHNNHNDSKTMSFNESSEEQEEQEDEEEEEEEEEGEENDAEERDEHLKNEAKLIESQHEIIDVNNERQTRELQDEVEGEVAANAAAAACGSNATNGSLEFIQLQQHSKQRQQQQHRRRRLQKQHSVGLFTQTSGTSAQTQNSTATLPPHPHSLSHSRSHSHHITDRPSPLVAEKQQQQQQSQSERKPRNKRMMSLYELETEQCKLEPKIEGRIRILGVNSK